MEDLKHIRKQNMLARSMLNACVHGEGKGNNKNA